MTDRLENKIGTLNEGDVHLQLKLAYAGFNENSCLEQPLNGFVADVVHDDVVYEIQTGGFDHLRQKLPVFLETHDVIVVYPVTTSKTIVKHLEDGSVQSRKSPKSENLFDLFNELAYIPSWLNHERFEIEAVFIEVEEHWTRDRTRGWRRKGWVVAGRKLLEIHDRRRIQSMDAMFDLVADKLPQEFSTLDLSRALDRSRRIGQKAAYCFRKSAVTEVCRKRGNELIYRRI